MAQFTVEIPDELLPGLVAELSTIPDAPTPEEYFQSSAVELIRQRAEAYKVGPYYVGFVAPRFNQDGTPYTPPLVEEEVVAVAVPDPEVNDTSTGGEV